MQDSEHFSPATSFNSVCLNVECHLKVDMGEGEAGEEERRSRMSARQLGCELKVVSVLETSRPLKHRVVSLLPSGSTHPWRNWVSFWLNSSCVTLDRSLGRELLREVHQESTEATISVALFSEVTSLSRESISSARSKPVK